MNTKTSHPLAKWLQAAKPEQRERMTALAGTSTNYAYQIAGLRREPGVCLAFGIEDATRTLHEETHGLLPVVTAREIAEAWSLGGL